jgi:hypothetical protein
MWMVMDELVGIFFHIFPRSHAPFTPSLFGGAWERIGMRLSVVSGTQFRRGASERVEHSDASRHRTAGYPAQKQAGFAAFQHSACKRFRFPNPASERNPRAGHSDAAVRHAAKRQKRNRKRTHNVERWNESNFHPRRRRRIRLWRRTCNLKPVTPTAPPSKIFVSPLSE